MFKVNDNYCKLPATYLFTEIARRVNTFQKENPSAKIIRMGIGDVTRPIIPVAIDALHNAVDDQADYTTFHGYGPEQGYDFLRSRIAENDYEKRGIHVELDEIFVSDGAKSDTGNIGDILSVDNIIAVTDPVYPVYVDTNVMAGRAGEFDGQKWSDIVYMPCTAENSFIPALPGAPSRYYISLLSQQSYRHNAHTRSA